MKRLLTVLVAAICLVVAASAVGGSRLEKLVRQLETADDFRVRVHAALELGKSKDARARSSLVEALDDKEESVRAAAAAALKNLGDKRALRALREHRLDRSKAVRAQIKDAIHALEAQPDPKVVVMLGSMQNDTRVKSSAALQMLRSASFRKLAEIPDIAVVEQSQGSSHGGLPVVMLTGSIRKLEASRNGSGVVYTAKVEYVLHKMPGQSIAGRVSGSASAEASADEAKDRRKRSEIRDAVLDAAVSSAMRRASQALLVVASS